MANMYKSNLEVGGITPTGNATSGDVLTGKTFMNSNGAQTGSMTNNGAVSGTATPSQPYTIPAGYHNGEGVVTASGGGDADLIAVAKSSYLWFIDLVNNKSIRALTGTYTVCNNVTLTILDGATCKFDANASVEKTVDTPVATVNNVITVSYTANSNYDVNATGINAFKFS